MRARRNKIRGNIVSNIYKLLHSINTHMIINKTVHLQSCQSFNQSPKHIQIAPVVCHNNRQIN